MCGMAITVRTVMNCILNGVVSGTLTHKNESRIMAVGGRFPLVPLHKMQLSVREFPSNSLA